jgi:carbonic anhydrase
VSGIDALLANAGRPAAQFKPAGLGARPACGVAVVACMDARLDVFAVLGLAAGDAHVIRNAGGVVTDDVIRSLVISQRMLGTTGIVLVHHTDCGMMSFTEDTIAAQVEADTGARPPFAFGAFADLDTNVRESIARLQASPFLPHRDAVRGFVYEVDSGTLREVTP